ncbi:hypothetical protein [uncultured Veillonella sp.]|uniref:hypothetical protein n=1 Tax=uncultured Veillonella sp. TaxID=159268 RepID=UPI00262632B4|nr:hypothetical protein [uncultured Veillonella sp.]
MGRNFFSRIMDGRVGPMSHGKKEIGFGPLHFTAEGQHTPLVLLGDTPVLHWHGDEFDIPEGAVRLAETDLCPNQAFSIGNHVLGLQFHLEADPTVIESWLVGHCAELCNTGIDIFKIREDAQTFSESLPVAGKKAMTAWLESNSL